MKTTKDPILKIMCHKNILDRELYSLQVLMYWFEKEIVSANYDYSKSNIDKTLLDNADEILEYLVRNYKNEDILSYKKLTQEQYYMFRKHNYNLEEYLKEYADKKGRLPIHNQPEYKKPWYKMSILHFFKNLFRRKRK